jgi:hypothetical protein
MPPSWPSGVSSSGVWRTAQRTIMNNPTIGIFSRNMSQMNVQVVTRNDRIPGSVSVQAPDGAASAFELEGGAAELRHGVQFLDARHDLTAAEALEALGAELLHVEGCKHCRMRHRAAQ